MNCHPPKVTSKARPSQRGFTLLEFSIATGISMFVFMVIAIITVFTARSFVAMGNYADLDRASRNALDIMTRDIRKTSTLTSYTSNKLTFTDYDGASLVYEYLSSPATLTRTKGGTNTILLKQCDYLYFNIYQRNPSNDFTFYPATSYSTAKLIDLSWKCSRKIFGNKVNTESVQTAKIVIRN